MCFENRQVITMQSNSVCVLGIGLELACNGGSCGEISMSRALEMTPRVSLSCKLVPGQYREYEYCLLTEANPEIHKTRSGGED